MRRAGPVTLCLALALVPALSTTGARAADDPGAPLQWGMDRIGTGAAWATTRGAGATIAVVDTGVDLDHEDLAGRILPGRDLVDDDDVAEDEEGHGTHVAGIAAATAGNGIGVIGVAPEATILPVRVLDGAGRGNLDDVAAGVRWATEQGADVVNLSLGPERGDIEPFPTSGQALRDAIDEAWAAGVVVVIAAGNDAALGLTEGSPAIVVAGTDRADGASTAAADDLTGIAFAMVAPGGEPGDTAETCATAPAGVLSTYQDDGDAGGYACLAGTSMAAPHVAGAAALLRSLGLDHVATRDRLLATATDLGAPGPDPAFGAGRLDVAAAVAGGGTGPPPAPASGAPPPAPPATAGVTGSSAGPGPLVTPGERPGTDGDGLRREGGAPAPSAVPVDGAALGTGGGGDDAGDRTVPALVALALVVVVGTAAVRLRRPAGA